MTRAPLDLTAALARLDRRLADAVDAFDAAQGGPTIDRLRGLYLTRADVDRALGHVGRPQSPRPATDPLWPADTGSVASRLADRFGLSSFDLDVLLVGLAPECDLRYERIYAYLQDDVTRRRPSIDLILNLLCETPSERLERRLSFAADAPLRAQSLIELVADPNQHRPPLLAQYVIPDEQVVREAVGGGVDSRLADVCRFDRTLQPAVLGFDEMVVGEPARQALLRAAALIDQGPTVVWLSGPAGSGKATAARAMAASRGAGLLTLDASRVSSADLELTLSRACREAEQHAALLFVRHAEAWIDGESAGARIGAALAATSISVVIGATAVTPAALLGTVVPIALAVPLAVDRARCWSAALERDGQRAPGAALVSTLAARFALTPGQIKAAVADAHRRTSSPLLADFAAAARAQTSCALEALADRITPVATWDDIVLSVEARAQLNELCQRVECRHRVLEEWGFARASGRGHGIAALFAGPSGTGKTMAAEVLAATLGLDLFRVDLARVVSKFIGETERNLSRIFAAAAQSNAILFFDEADALFGKRSDVKDAHDRYANIEISYLLQRMEEYDGLAILATNLPDNLDDAFTRRLAFSIAFTPPDEAARFEMWTRAWPAAVPVAPNVQRRVLARDLRMTGGTIRNVALGAAYYAASDGGVVTIEHVRHAVRREFDKQGRTGAVPPLASPTAAVRQGAGR